MRFLHNRFFILTIVLVAAFAILTTSFGKLTLVEGEQALAVGDQKRIKTLAIKGGRGRIMDRNGVILAFDQESFNIRFARDPAKTRQVDRMAYTNEIIKAIEIIEQNDGNVIDTFVIRRDEDMHFEFDWGSTDEKVKAKRHELWWQNMGLSADDSAETAYIKLRNNYFIPEEMGYDDAIKVLSIWQEVRQNAYRSYDPVVIAYNVNMKTVAEIESRNDEMPNMQVEESTVRIYPNGELAAHVIGYLSKMSSEQYDEKKAEGYGQDDNIGVLGIESTQETYLTGNINERQGSRVVEVNNRGNVMRELEYNPPGQGDDIMLTIDVKMQKKAEEALAENIRMARQEQEAAYEEKKEYYESKMAEQNRTTPLKMAEMGAAIVLDVKSGDVLAAASYPSFNLNLFTGGIKYSDYQSLLNSPGAPLYNKAITTNTPGSIFKMVTGTGALMEGDITLDTKIDDEGPYIKYETDSEKAPKCWAYPSGGYETHTDQNVVDAIKNSCNYFFYEVSDKMGIEKIDKWASIYGLTAKTNVQMVGEKAGQVGSQEALYNNKLSLNDQLTSKPILVYRLVRRLVEKYYLEYHEAEEIEDSEVLDRAAERIVQLVTSDDQIGGDIRAILKEELDIPEAMCISRRYDKELSDVLGEIRWNSSYTIQTGIGAGITLVSPMAVARYIAALVNGGTVYDCNIIKEIVDNEGNTVIKPEPTVYGTTGVKPEYTTAIKQAMHEVVSPEDSGTGKRFFEDWEKERSDKVGAKTGTGQVSDYEIEDNAWFVAFAPYEDPEIAIVVYIPNGMKGGIAGYTVSEILKYYFDSEEAKDDPDLPVMNSIYK